MKRTPLRRTPLRRAATRKPAPNADGFAWDMASAVVIVRGRSKGRCEFPGCRNPGEQFHHRMPRAMGGSRRWDIHSPANLLHLCREHHEWIESNREVAKRDGQIVPLGENPAEWRVETRHGYVWLLPSGRVTRRNPITPDA